MTEPARQPVYAFHGFRLDARRRVLLGADGQPIPLTPRLFDTLLYFVERAGQLLAKEQLLEDLWPNVVVEEHNLNKTVSELRRVLGEEPGEHKFIVTKPGRGYRFVADVSVSAADQSLGSSGAHVSAGLHGVGRYWIGAGVSIAALAGAVTVFGFLGSPPKPDLVLIPFSLEKGIERRAVWSPDGNSVAYTASEGAGVGTRLFVRDLASASARPITGELTNAWVQQWTASGRIIYAADAALWSISPVSTVPERIEGLDLSDVLVGAVARDGTAAVVRRGEDATWGVWTTPLSAIDLKKYENFPLGSRPPLAAGLEFSPDGRQLLLTWVLPPEQIWILPMPEDARQPPRRVLENLPPILGNGVSWLPDNAHLVVGTSDPAITTAPQLSIADTRSGAFRLLTNDGTDKAAPAVSPDGNRLVFLNQTVDFDIVSLTLDGARIQPLIATDNREEQARWSGRAAAMAYTTTRRGHYEIWFHRQGEADRPLVTPSDFATRQWLLSPAPSPDGTRVIFQAVDWQTGESNLWVRSTGGGALELVTDGAGNERAGSWSPDGAWYVYSTRQHGGTDTLQKVRTSGRARPEVLFTGMAPSPILPIWSADGEWILVAERSLKLVSADGKTIRELPIEGSPCGFYHTEALIYCLRASADGLRSLVALDFDGAIVDIIGSVADERAPRTSAGPLAPSLTLSLTPDGSRVTYSLANQSSSLWLMEGLSRAALP